MKKKVLIVDDSVFHRSQMENEFTDEQFSVFCAEDGEDALAVLESVGLVDLIICDLHMPKMDGLQFLAELRSTEAYKSVPFAMLTASFNSKEKKKAEHLGITLWLMKPLAPNLIQKFAVKVIGKQAV